MSVREFWYYVAAEMRCGWSVFLHGPEFWLGVTIWGMGAAFGIVFSWLMTTVKKKEEKEHEPTAPAVDRAAEHPGRDDDGGASGSERGGQK